MWSPLARSLWRRYCTWSPEPPDNKQKALRNEVGGHILHGLSIEVQLFASVILHLESHKERYIVFATYEMYHEYPLAAYLEYPVLIAQDVVLFMLILHSRGNLRQSFIYSIVFIGASKLLTLKAWTIDLAMSLCTLVSASSRFAQLQCLWQTKDSAHLSALTWALSTYTCMARILTTVLTSGDLKVLLRFIVMTTLNGWVLATVIFYKRKCDQLR